MPGVAELKFWSEELKLMVAGMCRLYFTDVDNTEGLTDREWAIEKTRILSIVSQAAEHMSQEEVEKAFPDFFRIKAFDDLCYYAGIAGGAAHDYNRSPCSSTADNSFRELLKSSGMPLSKAEIKVLINAWREGWKDAEDAERREAEALANTKFCDHDLPLQRCIECGR